MTDVRNRRKAIPKSCFNIGSRFVGYEEGKLGSFKKKSYFIWKFILYRCNKYSYGNGGTMGCTEGLFVRRVITPFIFAFNSGVNNINHLYLYLVRILHKSIKVIKVGNMFNVLDRSLQNKLCQTRQVARIYEEEKFNIPSAVTCPRKFLSESEI